MIRLKVNGDQRSFDGDPEMPLLWYLRDEAGLKGTKFGCGIAECGACTVHVDGRAVREWARWAFRHWPRRCATLYSRRPERVSAHCP